MKRIIAALLCSAMLLAMAGCSVTVSKPDPSETPGISITTNTENK